jgi:hypothetical protein
VLATAVSCGGGGQGDETVRDEPLDTSPQAVCAFYAERDCAAWQKCNAPEVRYFFGGDLATCKERSTLGCVSRVTATGTNQKPSQVVECARAVAALSCETYLDFERWPEACAIPPGNLSDGAACIASAQCQGGHCAISNTEPCGVCRATSRAGEACGVQADCLDLMPCVNGVCVPHPKLGEPCDAKERACVAGLVCRNLDAAGEGICEKLLSVGAPCDPRSPAGEECDYTQSYACDPVARICGVAADPFGGVGAPCGSSGECNAVSFCRGGVCRARPRDGELCTVGVMECVHPARCIHGLCTVRDSAVCQ